MKVVHKKEEVDIPEGLLDQAKYFEKNKDVKKAIGAYEKLVRENPLNEFGYNRLMILHRKEKDFKQEKTTID
ncbi:MAG: hypothetical protein EOP48_28910, partial [Sphingobacteriales bacterium]